MKVLPTSIITAVSASSSNANYPASNLLDDHPKKVWKGTGATETLTFTMDGWANSFFLFNTNATGISFVLVDPNFIEWETGVSWASNNTYGAELVTGTDSTMAGANNWTSTTLGTLDINTTVPGKLYMLGDGGDDNAYLPATLEVGAEYFISLKARLNAGASTTIRVGGGIATAGSYFTMTPTGTEATYQGFITAAGTNLRIGLAAGFNGVAFEIDDVSVKKITTASVAWATNEAGEAVISLIDLNGTSGSCMVTWTTIATTIQLVASLANENGDVLKAGVAVGGAIKSYRDPSYEGFSEGVKDYSITAELSSGATYYKGRDAVRVFNASVLLLRDTSFDDFIFNVAKVVKSGPAAWAVTDENDSRWLAWARFTKLPTADHHSPDWSTVNFELTEVV